jgi:hypothetical protein
VTYRLPSDDIRSAILVEVGMMVRFRVQDPAGRAVLEKEGVCIQDRRDGTVWVEVKRLHGPGPIVHAIAVDDVVAVWSPWSRTFRPTGCT